MGYKSEKINRRKYFKKSSRKNKKMFGGEKVIPGNNNNNNNEYNLPPPPIPISLQEETELPPPTMVKNVKEIGNLTASALTNVLASGLNSASETLGIDPKSPSESVSELSKSGENILNALKSPEGEKLQEEAGELVEDIVDIAKPGIKKVVDIGNELVKEEIPIAGNMINELVLATPGVGQVVAAVEEVGNVGQAIEKATKSVADLTTVGSETAKSLEEEKEKVSSFVDKAKKLFNNISQGINTGVSSVIESAKKRVDDYGQDVVKKSMENNQPIQSVDKSLKKYQKEKIMIGGRITKSQLDFLTPHVKRSQILRQYGGKWNTRRKYSLKHKITSRRW